MVSVPEFAETASGMSGHLQEELDRSTLSIGRVRNESDSAAEDEMQMRDCIRSPTDHEKDATAPLLAEQPMEFSRLASSHAAADRTVKAAVLLKRKRPKARMAPWTRWLAVERSKEEDWPTTC